MSQDKSLKIGSVLLATVLLVFYAMSGIFVVDYDQEGVIKTFGKITKKHVSPGIHYIFPWPFQKVERVNVSTVRRQGLGFDLEQEDLQSPKAILESQFLTGDRNIISIRLVVQYDIDDPGQFLFTTENPQTLLKRIGETSITRQLAQMGVDRVLTTEQIPFAVAITEDLQRDVDMFQLGIHIDSVQVKEVIHPKGVASAFNDVSSAREDYSRMLHEAEGYSYQAKPKANAKSHKITTEAEAYKQKRINTATGEAERFKLLAGEAQIDSQNLKTRLYYATLEEIWPKMRKYLVGTGVVTIKLQEPTLTKINRDPN